jgi:hypothetical protein
MIFKTGEVKSLWEYMVQMIKVVREYIPNTTHG